MGLNNPAWPSEPDLSHMKSDSGNAADAALHAAVAEDCDTYPCKLAHAEFIRVVPSDGPQADAFPATMLTSQNGIRELHSGPKYGRIEIGNHKLTKIDRGRDLATLEISENRIARRQRVRVSRPSPRQWL
jgi:hypothetical protein